DGTERRSIVEVSAAIPVAIPGLAFERSFERADMQAPCFGAAVLAARVGEPGKLPKYGVQEPAEPDAFALSSGADPVHAVVPVSRPHQRKAVLSNRQTTVERARAVLEHGGPVFRHMGLEIRLVLSRRQRRPVEERNGFI